MRLLFDQNLSRYLRVLLSDLYPGSLQVREIGLADAPDTVIWAYAIEHGLVIVTKDADYRDLSVARGHPPKVVWIRLGNCPTSEVADLLRERHGELLAFQRNDAAGLLELP